MIMQVKLAKKQQKYFYDTRKVSYLFDVAEQTICSSICEYNPLVVKGIGVTLNILKDLVRYDIVSIVPIPIYKDVGTPILSLLLFHSWSRNGYKTNNRLM